MDRAKVICCHEVSCWHNSDLGGCALLSRLLKRKRKCRRGSNPFRSAPWIVCLFRRVIALATDNSIVGRRRTVARTFADPEPSLRKPVLRVHLSGFECQLGLCWEVSRECLGKRGEPLSY